MLRFFAAYVCTAAVLFPLDLIWIGGIARGFYRDGLGPIMATAFHRDDLLGRRVRRLVGEDTPVGTHLTRRSALGAALALSAVWASGLIVVHPLAAEAGHVSSRVTAEAHHCTHENGWPFSHLFCRSAAAHAHGTATGTGDAHHCPHAS